MGVRMRAMAGVRTTARTSQTTRAWLSQSQSWRTSASGVSRAAWMSSLAERGIGAVRNSQLPRRMKGMTRMSWSGYARWLAICEATTLRRKTNARARQRTVVVQRMGLMPMSAPTARLQANFCGEAPRRSRARMGKTMRR